MTACDRRTITQILVKGNFPHSEFGIKAGFLSRFCLPTHRTKTDINNKLTVNSAVMSACLMDKVLFDIILSN